MIGCLKCQGHLHQIATFYPSPPGKVFECPKCRTRYTENELEDGMICAGCGEFVKDEGESLCVDCLSALANKKLSYE
jgi:hypothetical protein